MWGGLATNRTVGDGLKDPLDLTFSTLWIIVDCLSFHVKVALQQL